MRPHHLVLFILSTWQFTECNAGCNSLNVGSVFCVRSYSYYDWQWATCLTDAYIRLKSKQTHRCVDRTATYCYYQCMLESHGRESGYVYSDCRCNQYENPPSTPSSPLPSWCYSPDRTKCTWYQQCLKQRYSCNENGDKDYGIKYAETFCKLYTNHYSWYSSAARQWINGTRECLEISLVPLLRPWQTKSCSILKEKAFASLKSCYKSSGQTKTSFCSLLFTDQMKVFWTIKAGLTSTFTPSLKETWDILSACRNNGWVSLDRVETEFSQFQLDFYGKELEADDLEKLGYLASRVIDEIASRQGWRNEGLAWFAFASKTSSQTQDFVTITTLLADRYTFEAPGATFFTRPSRPVMANVTLSEMTEAVKNGSFNTLDTGTEKVTLMRMKGCANWLCTQSSFEVSTSFTPPHSASSKIKSFTGGAVYLASLTILLLYRAVCG